MFPTFERQPIDVSAVSAAHKEATKARRKVAGTDDKRMQAWQHLIDTGLAWQLQGGFGRTAMSLIESGICSPPKPIPAP